MKKSPTVKLDLRDKKLIQALDFHARKSYTQLAKETGLSKQGAEYKLKNLIKKGVIKGFYPVINVPKLGYIYCRLSLTLQNVDEKKEKEILNYITKQKQFFWVFTTQGMFDFLLVMWAKSLTEFEKAVQELLKKYGNYIKAKNETITTDVIHYQHRYLLPKEKTEEIHLKETQERIILDNEEKEILKVLCEDARTPIINIAKKTCMNAKTVSYKIKKLEKKKIIEGYRPIINHHALGYTYYKLWITVYYENMSEIKKLHEYIKCNPIVLYIVKGLGLPEDLDIEIMVKDNTELFSFVKDLKRRFPKLIGDYRSFMFIDVKKVRYLPF